MRMTWDRKAERTKKFNKRKDSKNKTKTKNYRKSQLREEEGLDDIKNWNSGLLGDSD